MGRALINNQVVVIVVVMMMMVLVVLLMVMLWLLINVFGLGYTQKLVIDVVRVLVTEVLMI